MNAVENLQLLAHSRLNLCARQRDRYQMKQITEIQLHRSHWATASEEEGGGETRAGKRSDGKTNRIGDKTGWRQAETKE